MSETKTYTVICRILASVPSDTDEETYWIDTVEAEDALEAAGEGTHIAAKSFDLDDEEMLCVGVIEGAVKIAFWNFFCTP